MSRPRTVVVLPAYNAEKTLAATIAALPAGCADEIILVDDHSGDGTVELARSLGLRVIRHESNRGYGGTRRPATARLWPGAPSAS